MPQKAIKPAHSAGFQVFLAEREGIELNRVKHSKST
tara:strand:- start:540 stop:647 length:108 start_codon:yes stop_codon:yes gene_type:complete